MPGRVQASGRSGAVKTAPRETDMNYNTDEKQKSMAPEETAKPSYWAVLPAAIRYDPEITAGAKLLYAEITSLADARGYCWATNGYFQKLYGISEPTVQRYLRALKAAGYIRIQDGNGGSAVRRIYAGVNPLGTNPVKNDGVPPSKLTGGDVKNDGGSPSKMTGSTINKKIKQEKEQPPKAPQGAAWEPEMFERFWKAYPCKRDKASARREWDRLEPDRKLMLTMSAALKRQKASEQWQREIGIPYACRWLRNRRWEDELEEPGGPPRASAPTDERRDVLWI